MEYQCDILFCITVGWGQLLLVQTKGKQGLQLKDRHKTKMLLELGQLKAQLEQNPDSRTEHLREEQKTHQQSYHQISETEQDLHTCQFLT